MKLKNRNPKMVEILNDKKATFKCKVCNQIWEPILRSEGRISKGGWHCPNGCTLEDLGYKEREHYREVIKSES